MPGASNKNQQSMRSMVGLLSLLALTSSPSCGGFQSKPDDAPQQPMPAECEGLDSTDCKTLTGLEADADKVAKTAEELRAQMDKEGAAACAEDPALRVLYLVGDATRLIGKRNLARPPVKERFGEERVRAAINATTDVHARIIDVCKQP